jgi:hypothetical protein
LRSDSLGLFIAFAGGSSMSASETGDVWELIDPMTVAWFGLCFGE